MVVTQYVVYSKDQEGNLDLREVASIRYCGKEAIIIAKRMMDKIKAEGKEAVFATTVLTDLPYDGHQCCLIHPAPYDQYIDHKCCLHSSGDFKEHGWLPS